MHEDLIVDEIHKIREKMLEECGGDLNKLMDRIATEGTKHPNRVQSPSELRQITDARGVGDKMSS